MDYILKYNKYNKKCENMNGGIIGIIPKDKLTEIKNDYSIPEKINKYVKLITIPNTKIIRVGSSMNKIQPYFSDIDVMNIVEKNISTVEFLLYFISELQKLVKNILEMKNIFFSDFKAGGLHWTFEEILLGEKEGLSLFDACRVKDVIKLDIIGPYDERYLEMSTFFILKSIDGFINVNADYFDTLEKSLLNDIAEYKNVKPFKAIKRLWSLSRIKSDINTLDRLKDLVKSNIALLAQINADLETVVLLLKHKNQYDTNFVINELNGFKEKVSSILDIDIDQLKVDIMLNNLITLFKYNDNKDENVNNIVQNIELLHGYLLEIINRETNEYLKHIDFSFDKKTSILQKIKDILF